MNLSQILKNKVIFYMASRYVTYGIQFITSMVIAVKLGPYYMGIWGFILLLLNYFQQCHFGIANSLNVLLIHSKNELVKKNNYIANSVILVCWVSLIVILLYLYYIIFDIQGLEKYHVGKYALLIVLIAIMQYFNMLFINIFRIKNMINAVTFNQSIIVLLNFACIFFFQKETLIMMLVCGYVLGNLLCIVLALYDKIIPPYKQWQLHINIQKEILKKGMYLFLYNSCFYFIIISIRTIVSIYYSVEQFGMFTFSFTLGHAIMLLLDAFSFIIFPKIIDKLSSPNIAQIKDTLTKLRTYYISLAHLLIFTALPLFPLLLHFFPKYQEGLLALNLIALTIVMNAYNFGYTSLLIARNKEKWSAVISFCALVINCLLGITMVKIFHVDFSYVILATMITYLLFSFATIVAGRKLLNLHGGIWRDERKIIINLGCPLLLALAFSIVNETFIWTPLALYLVLNYKDVKTIKNMVTRIVKSPNVVNL